MSERAQLSAAAELVGASNLNGPEPSFNTGASIASTTLNAVTAATTGTTVDAGGAKNHWTAIAVVTGSPTSGLLTLELSVDGTNWVFSGSSANTTAAGNYLIVSSMRPARFARVSLSNVTGTITATVKMMAAD